MFVYFVIFIVTKTKFQSCSSWGDPHFSSFNNTLFNFFSGGDYNFASWYDYVISFYTLTLLLLARNFCKIHFLVQFAKLFQRFPPKYRISTKFWCHLNVLFKREIWRLLRWNSESINMQIYNAFIRFYVLFYVIIYHIYNLKSYYK